MRDMAWLRGYGGHETAFGLYKKVPTVGKHCSSWPEKWRQLFGVEIPN